MNHGGMDVTEWLLDSDPSIRWQVMRDLTDASPDAVAPVLVPAPVAAVVLQGEQLRAPAVGRDA